MDTTEIVKEVQEIIENPDDVISNCCETPVHNLQDACAELKKEDPNYVKVGIYTVFAIIATVGVPLGVWFASR